MNQLYTTLIFDYDGVMTSDEYAGVGKYCFDEAWFEALEWKYSDVMDDSLFLKELRNEYHFEASDQEFWRDFNREQSTGMLEELGRYRKHRLLLLTDQVTSRSEYLKKSHDFSMFEKTYFSNETGHKKPHVETFQFVLNDSGLSAEECIFIDDTLENIEAAKTLGIEGILFQNKDQCIAELEKFLDRS